MSSVANLSTYREDQYTKYDLNLTRNASTQIYTATVDCEFVLVPSRDMCIKINGNANASSYDFRLLMGNTAPNAWLEIKNLDMIQRNPTLKGLAPYSNNNYDNGYGEIIQFNLKKGDTVNVYTDGVTPYGYYYVKSI